MSYTTSTLSIIDQDIEGGQKEFWYRTADTIQQVLATGYFTDALQKRMGIGDLVFVLSGTPATATLTEGAAVFPNTVGLGGDFASAPTLQPCIVSSISAGAAMVVPCLSIPTDLADFPRNLIDGGDFTVNPWQRGTAINAIANTLTYTADRFFAISGASASVQVSKQANTDVAGFSQALQLQRSSTDTHTSGITLGQVFETIDSVRAQGLPVTLSFWAKAGANFAAGSNGQITAMVSGGTGTDDSAANLVAGSWTTQASVISSAQAITATMTRYSFTGTVPATMTQLGVMLAYTPAAGTTAGANEWVQFMGVQLEVGARATNYEHQDAQIALEIAQRYYYQLNEGTTGQIGGVGSAFTASTGQIMIPLPVQMRIAPTVTVSIGGFRLSDGAGTGHLISSAGSAATTHSVNAVGLNLTAAATLTAGQTALLVGQTTNNGKIQVSAEY